MNVGNEPYWLDLVHEPHHHSSAQRMAWLDKVRASRKSQKSPIAVAEGASFTGPGGRAYNSGDPLDPKVFLARELDKLEGCNLIVRLTPGELAARASVGARFRVAEGNAILTRSGIVEEGCEVTESHFEGGLERIRELIKRCVITETPGAK